MSEWKLSETYTVIVEGSDLDVAELEISRLMKENELLRNENFDVSNQLDVSINATEELARLNNITMHMVRG